ncbi:MAG: hypothetical protein VKL42_13100 [Snowella sp.]|nr:hypothetical protein [Snowella sp.]
MITAVDYFSGDRAISSENSLMFLGSGTGQIGDGDRSLSLKHIIQNPPKRQQAPEKGGYSDNWSLDIE